MSCWACGKHGRVHRWWCRATPAGPTRTAEDARKLARLIKAQARDMKLRSRFQPPEHPQGRGRTLSLEWCLERHMEPYFERTVP